MWRWRRVSLYLAMRGMEAPVKYLIPVALVGALLVVGCKNKKNEAAQPPTPPSELTTAQPMPAPVPATPTYQPAPEPSVTVAPTPVPAPTPAAKPAAAPKPAAAKPAAAKPAAKPSAKTYTIKRGDTLSEIAKANKTTIKAIMAVNPSIKTPDHIEIGKTIKLP